MKIIINADDLGRSEERNAAIAYAFKNKLITSSSLMPCMVFAQNAVDEAFRGGVFE